MALTVDQASLQVVLDALDELILGIITSREEVRFVVSDPVKIPGHVEWVSRADTKDAIRGFSIGVANGKVRWLFPVSRLNRTLDSMLDDKYVQEIKRILPLSDGFAVLLS